MSTAARIQDQTVKLTQRAVDDLIRAVEALPPDRRDWKPAETARSALDQLREVAVAPDWFVPILESGVASQFTDHDRRALLEARRELDTFEKCRERALASTSRLCAAISTLPDSRLSDEVRLPFGGGQIATVADVAGLHYWNATYHLGQVNYIQTLLGDLAMH